MATCPYCGSEVSFSAKFCTKCGAKLAEVPVEQTAPAAYQPVSLNEEDTAWPGAEPASNQEETVPEAGEPYAQPFTVAQPYNQPQTVAPVPTGGLLAWAIITLLLCTIPGIVAIVKTVSINKATTVEEQMKRINSAKTWCIVGTVLGALQLIGVFAGNM